MLEHGGSENGFQASVGFVTLKYDYRKNAYGSA